MGKFFGSQFFGDLLEYVAVWIFGVFGQKLASFDYMRSDYLVLAIVFPVHFFLFGGCEHNMPISNLGGMRIVFCAIFSMAATIHVLYRECHKILKENY